jgi:hypothetical protein
MPGSSTPVEVFYSYAHEDEALRTELEKHLSLLRRLGVITGCMIGILPLAPTGHRPSTSI